MNNYNDLLVAIKPGDVILTCDSVSSPMSLPIKIVNYFKLGPKKYQDRGWTHAAVYIGNGQVIEAFPNGIIRRGLKEAYLNEKFGLNILRRKGINEKNIKTAIDFYNNETGAKYDFKGLAYFILANFIPPQFNFIIDDDYVGKLFNVNDSYFCSELVSEGFKRANIYCFERQPYKVMPIEFDNELLFDCIYRQYLPKKENKFIYGFKAVVFNIFYLLAAVLFPIVITLLLFALVLVFIIVIIGIIATVKNISAKAKAAKEKEDRK